ncbi:MAG: hypothetical protein JST55_11225 [Bacteroidetes bacterium]|nr:hypothetical protein [Bacteroidota bacterium]
MKILIVLSLLFSFLSWNLFAQSSASITDTSLSTNTLYKSNKSIKSLTKDSTEQTSDKDSGMLIGAVVGGCSGILIGVLASSFSLEPHSDTKISFPAVLVGGVAGALVGAIIGGIASEK